MDFGFSIPHRGPLANPADQKRLAQTGERLGYAALTVSDHIVIPRDIGSKYPYSETGDFPGSRSGEALEMIALLAFLCGVTEKARLITSVMVLPHRNPVLAAKQLATADLLSGGRVTVGCGVGWMREEFEAVGLPPFDERGRVADEYLRVFKAVWTEDPASFAGDYASFSNVSTLPHPVQKPHPPLWIGARAGRRSAASQHSATPGIPSATIRAPCSTAWSATGPGATCCSGSPKKPGATPPRSGSPIPPPGISRRPRRTAGTAGASSPAARKSAPATSARSASSASAASS